MKKKSYMNKDSLLNENFLKGLMSAIKGGRLQKKLKQKKITKKMYNKLDDLNDSLEETEKLFKELYGVKLNFNRFDISDFEDEE